ncbi:MAG: hypothetical protein J6Y02_14585 [Pseudobutyrivibrio sp.]|nr:hypothetical protein [Pseudobutyrivibrio sp.]
MTTNEFQEALQVRECLFGIHCCVDDEAMIKSLDTIMRSAPDYTFDQAIKAVQAEIADTNRIQEACTAIIPDENARDEAIEQLQVAFNLTHTPQRRAYALGIVSGILTTVQTELACKAYSVVNKYATKLMDNNTDSEAVEGQHDPLWFCRKETK